MTPTPPLNHANPPATPDAPGPAMAAGQATASPQQARRQAWLRTLALADAELLARHADAALADFRFEALRGPETGMVLVRARIGGGGERFNLGEATLARCVVRHQAPDGQAIAGVGHVLGRDGQRAWRIACLDALLQRADLQAHLQQAVLAPLAAHTAAREQAERADTEASRVHFYTLQPEVAA